MDEEIIIPVLAILCAIALPLILVILSVYWTVTSKHKEKMAMIERGIAPDEINHVWERYYKSSTHHVRPTDGSGLGLSIVKEILTLHKADYGVNSKVGKGSTFWFELELVKK